MRARGEIFTADDQQDKAPDSGSFSLRLIFTGC
jgi:hypothetical protein